MPAEKKRAKKAKKTKKERQQRPRIPPLAAPSNYEVSFRVKGKSFAVAIKPESCGNVVLIVNPRQLGPAISDKIQELDSKQERELDPQLAAARRWNIDDLDAWMVADGSEAHRRRLRALTGSLSFPPQRIKPIEQESPLHLWDMRSDLCSCAMTAEMVVRSIRGERAKTRPRIAMFFAEKNSDPSGCYYDTKFCVMDPLQAEPVWEHCDPEDWHVVYAHAHEVPHLTLTDESYTRTCTRWAAITCALHAIVSFCSGFPHAAEFVVFGTAFAVSVVACVNSRQQMLCIPESVSYCEQVQGVAVDLVVIPETLLQELVLVEWLRFRSNQTQQADADAVNRAKRRTPDLPPATTAEINKISVVIHAMRAAAARQSLPTESEPATSDTS